MKKIFTLLCGIMVAICATAQIEVTTEDGKVIKEGDKVTFYAEEVELFPGFTIVMCEPAAPFIENKGGSPAPVAVTVEKITPNAPLSLCCFNGCEIINGESFTKNGNIESHEKEGVQLHLGELQIGDYKTVQTKVTITSGSFKLSYIQEFVYDKEHATGIESTQGDKVSVANNQLSYNFSNNAHRALNIYGVSGRLMKRFNLSQSGTVDLQLQRGVYIYEILANGKRVATHKFIIK